MRNRLLGSVILIAVASQVLLACGGSDAKSLDGIRYALARIDTGSTTDLVVANTEPWIEFQGSDVFGSDGCNGITGTASFGGSDGVAVSLLATTQMACPPAVMDQGQTITTILAAVTSYQQDGGTLTLATDDGRGLIYEEP